MCWPGSSQLSCGPVAGALKAHGLLCRGCQSAVGRPEHTASTAPVCRTTTVSMQSDILDQPGGKAHLRWVMSLLPNLRSSCSAMSQSPLASADTYGQTESLQCLCPG